MCQLQEGGAMKDQVSTISANIKEAGDTLSANFSAPVSISANVVEEGDKLSASITTVGEIVEKLKDIGSEMERRQVRGWFEEHYGDWAEIIENLESFTRNVEQSLSELISSDTLQNIIDVITNLFQ